ncbi:MAG: protoporphyrinogen oxidase [Desulfobulbaceae bacterium]|nr:protoporphyrinogen oxidase [Desulfobulbaceae bacterium]
MTMHKTDICIVGSGISGLAAATFLRKEQPERSLLVLEKDERPGGAIRSYHSEGYLAEWGPHGFLDNREESRELINLAGLKKNTVTAPLGRFVRYLCLNGRLSMVPQTPSRILMAPLISWPEKLRILGDLQRPYYAGEPTVAQWVEHRFGPALLPFADAIYTGTYAGDITKLRIDGVMPRLRRLEQEHGSVLKALFSRMRARSRERKVAGQSKPGLPAMTSFTAGMEQFPLALAKLLHNASCLQLNTLVQGVRQHQDGWILNTERAEEYHCRHLVLALPINAALALMRAVLPEQPPPTEFLPEARIDSVLLGFGPEAAIPFGFGYLAPEQEKRFSLGALFSTHMFPERSPEGEQLLEILVGGRRHPERLQLSDNDMIEQAYADVRQLIALPKEPRFAAVLRPEAGIPQPEEGYLKLLAWREEVEKRHSNLHILGFGWKGIGLNEMVHEAKLLARTLAAKPMVSTEELKGIYV